MPYTPITITRRQHKDLMAGGRIFEWFSALEMAAFGLALLHPDPAFSTRAFVGFVRIGVSENFVGGSSFAVGVLWCVALYINGSWRRSPMLRFACALAGGSFWGCVSFTFAIAYFQFGAPISTAMGTYALSCVFTFFAARRAVYDAIAN